MIRYLFWVSTSLLLMNFSRTDIVFPNDLGTYASSECRNSYGVRGVCKKISECNSGHKFIKQNDLCAFEKDIPLYCCPNAAENLKLNRTSARSDHEVITDVLEGSAGDRPIQKICQYYKSFQKISLIIFGGGRKSLEGEQAHMAAIGWSKQNGKIDWKCGGSVVTTNFILTAAHCTSSKGIKPDKARTGDLDLEADEDHLTLQDYNITHVYVHPNYTGRDLYHDIALLQIEPDYKIRNYTLPACLWYSYEIPVENLTAMGFGTRSFGGPQSNELYQGDLKYQKHHECTRNIPLSSDIPQGIIREQICAYSPYADTCQADSGGPLQFWFSGAPHIAGVTSFGFSCLGNIPGVYTRVSEYLNWIESILLPSFRPVKEEY